MRRVMEANSDLVARRLQATPTSEQYSLFRAYIDARHADGGMADMTVLDYAMMVEDSIIDTFMTEYRLQPEPLAKATRASKRPLVGVALCDRLSDGISMVYSFYEPEAARRGLGTYMILEHIAYAKRLGVPYLYLGYWINGSPKMSYKRRFQPAGAAHRQRLGAAVASPSILSLTLSNRSRYHAPTAADRALVRARARSDGGGTMARTAIEVRPIAGSVGAEISGVDLSGDVGDETVAAIRQAWLDHCVIFFRDQDLPPARFLTFAKRFGKVIEYPFIKGLEEYPEIIPVMKLEHEKTNFGGIWHSDTAYLETPPMGTMLVAREVPPQGGDTMFANTYLAYETLSDGMKQHARRPDRHQHLGQGRRQPHARGSRARRACAPTSRRNTWASTRSCARIPRRAARRSISTSATRCASRT